MGVNSLSKTVTRQRRDCDLNPGPSAPESSTLTTRLPSYPGRQLPSHVSDMLDSCLLPHFRYGGLTGCAVNHRHVNEPGERGRLETGKVRASHCRRRVGACPGPATH